ncbi:MAG: cofactor-independent phosphoglycerate mutase [Clostridia bacterium]|nr:cofactor-independent phosphoglycerate mutase [Clostridia bacterium]
MKYITILMDGAGDFPIGELDGKTPYEYAKTPTLDQLSPKSLLGTFRTIPDGMPPGSDVANLSALGYDPRQYHTGRSPLEAASIGIPLVDTDVTFRCNFVTVSEDEADYREKTMLDHSAGELSTEDSAVLLEAIKPLINDDVFSIYLGTSYRNLIVMKNGTINVNLVPPHDFLGKKIKDNLPSGGIGDMIFALQEKCHEVLARHPLNATRKAEGKNPANAISIWGEGKKPMLEDYARKYGVKGAVISAVDLIKGIGVLAGMQVIDVPDATGTIHTNFSGKAEAAVRALSDGADFVFLHLEAPDECSHQGDLPGKIRSIEIIDEKVIRYIAGQLSERGLDFKLLVLPDHYTPITMRTHTDVPVPFMIYDSTKELKGDLFSEANCQKTGLYIDACERLVKMFFALD